MVYGRVGSVPKKLRVAAVVALALVGCSTQAFAQNWSFDARSIGMGSVGGSGNLATKMIDEQRDYTAIVLPLGLTQVLKNRNIFDPDSKEFDPIRSVEFAASPLHYIVGRSTSNSGEALFVNDVRNATLNRKLSVYKGFVPANDLLAEGLATPNFGGTIKLRKDGAGGFQGIYVGAGPYLSMHTAATIDQGLTTVLSSGVDKANAQFPINEADEGQFALAITGGYRGRFAWPDGVGSGTPREGLYVAANYNYLRGFWYENDAMSVRFLTDTSGLITNASNISIAHRHASDGTGMALDFGVGAVVDHWEVGFGARGVANRINWSGVEATTYTLASLTSGDSDFKASNTVSVADTRVELPVDLRGDIAYYADQWTAAAEIGHGFGGNAFHGGIERRFNRIELRGGVRYTVKKWNPTAGVGFNLSPRVSFDVATYGTTANIERKRQTAIAFSLRINHLS